ncbi:hypothetical protein [Bdellovibrio bacteriovorus]|uniref:hypothetical protein n=1 Tax=Bdellovibrio bacteriovorus TaxID=959 RepID=UPI003CFEAC79
MKGEFWINLPSKDIEKTRKFYTELACYGCGFFDPDGHRWNILFMNMSKMPK